MRRLFAVAAFLLTLAPMPGLAQSYQISLTSTVFTPEVRADLVAGDEIAWKWLDGRHSVTAYLGAGFDSGFRDYGTGEFLQTYQGGVVHYRCLVHSRLSDGYRCTGMCGVLTDRALERVAPSAAIESPAANAIVLPEPATPTSSAVTIAGTARDDSAVAEVLVRIYDTTGKASEHVSTCTDCGTVDARWTLTTRLMPGSYVAEVIAVDASGNIPATFPRTNFFVL